MGGKLKAAGVIFLACLALGAGWALWMGIKVLAWIAIAGLVAGVAISVAMRPRSSRKVAGPDDPARLS